MIIFFGANLDGECLLFSWRFVCLFACLFVCLFLTIPTEVSSAERVSAKETLKLFV